MMDAGLLDKIQNDNNFQFKTDAPPQGDVKSQEVQDDGYETSNGADQQQQQQAASSSSGTEATAEKPAEHQAKTPEPPGPDLENNSKSNSKPSSPEVTTDMEGEGKQQAAEGGDEPDATITQKEENKSMDEEMESKSESTPVVEEEDNKPVQERLNETLTDAPVANSEENSNVARESRSNSNSPKRLSNVNSNCSNNLNNNNDQLANEDSNASMREQLASSPCASNSPSNSSSLDRQQNLPFNNNKSVENFATTEPNINQLTQEDSSSQSQGYPVNAATQMDQQMNPYDMKRLQPSYMPMTSFGGIKREPYDMSTGGAPDQQHNDPYGHFKRQDDPYSRENIDPYRNQYKRPEEMFMGGYNKDEMSYGGFGGIKRDSMNPYYNSGQFVGGLKREHDDVMGYNGVKRECSEDPYSFVDEDAAVCAMLGQQGGMGGPGGGQMHPDLMQQHMMQNAPKKRGRKKKIKDECDIKQEPGPDGMMPLVVKPIKERKKHDRFNGMPEEEVCRRTLPDHLAENLDIIIIGINPGLFAAYKGHHYAGPGNHFWKCLYLSGLTQEQMSADEDYKLLHFGIGFTNMVSRATKGSADLTRKEIKEGSQILLEKLQTFRPKIAVFNGKLIYEVFSGKKDFNFGRQPDTVHGTNTYMWVMPSSSARCAQLPRAADKVPFYSALRRFRDYLNGTLAHVDEAELVFPDTTCRREREENEIRRLLGPETPCETMVLEDGTEVPIKKKRGRPKKIKLENGEVAPSAPRPPRPPRPPQPVELGPNGELPPKKKRGRPKKVRPEDQAFMVQQQQNNSMVTPLPNMPLSSQLNMSNPQSMDGNYSQSLMGSGRDYTQQGLSMDTSSSMMYGNAMGQNTMSGGGPIQGQNLAVNVPQTSPYFGQGLSSGNQDSGDVMPGTPGAMGMRNQPGFGQSPGPFSQSPRSQGVGYGSSPRPAGYSQSPQRHQMAGSYSNSPAHQQQSTALPFSQSPVPQSAHYSQSPPLRPHSQNHNYSQQSPVPGHSYSRSPVPQNNTPTYSQQSPMFAQSPANMQHPYSQSPVPQNQRFSQASPASQNMAYQCRSPGPPMDHAGTSYQPSSPLQQSASYPQLSPVRANQSGYSQSPIPQNSNIYAHPQMMSPGSSQNYSQRSHPYSPAPHIHSGYGQSPIHQPQSRQNTPYNQSPPQNMSMNAASGNSGGNATTIAQQYQSDLSSEISAAISSPGPASPGIGHIDFEPPIIDSQIQTQEAENSSSRSISQRTSPGGDQMTPNDLGQNSSNMVSETALNAMGDVSHASSHDSNDIMDTCTNTMMQMASNHPLNSQNRHSALNLIGPSSSSNTSSPIPSAMDATKPGLDMSRNSTTFAASSGVYNNSQPGSNEAQSPVSNEQRLGFQVPTPSGSANSSYGTVTPVAADLSNVPRNSPRDIDNASVASVSSQHERSYPLSGYPDAAGSPRQSDTGGLLAHHAASMYHSNPFSRMGSTPPQSSPFSSQSGGAFRGISGLEHGSPQQGPVDYGSPVKQSSTTTKQQDVSSKSLSGLESLVDQIPSIADGGPSALSSEVAPHAAAATGPTTVPTLENPYAAHAPLYNPYPYQPTPYAPPPVSNNSYSSLAASSFVGYPGSPYGQLMRPTPGYLPEALSAYHPAHHSGYPGLSTQQYGPGAGYGPAGPTPNYSAYYNGYGPPSIPNTPNMPTYLTSHVLDHIHKNAAADASSVSFGGFC